MQSIKVLVYEFPDLTRSMDILLGIILSFGLKYCWHKRNQIREILTKNFTYIFVGTVQGMILWLYLAGSTHYDALLVMGIGSIGILFQDGRIWDMIFRRIM